MLPAALLALVPTVADMIFGDKTGKTVQKVVDVAGEFLGLDTAQRTPENVDAAVRALPPDKLVDFKIAMAKLAAEERAAQRAADQADLQAHIDNTINARTQTIELAKLGHGLAWAPAIVTAIVLFTFGWVMNLVLTAQIPAGQERLADTMIGILGTLAVASVMYWVGSSRGSARKDELLAAAPPVGSK
jgi:hypothetical protein